MRCAQTVLDQMDAALASLARGEAALRLRLGQVLDMLSRGGVFELGFSSPSAYAVERCERSVRWAEGACCMARRLEKLPALRQTVACGRVSWSMAELLARVAQPEDEARWIDLAESRTVRQMRVHVAKAAACRQNPCDPRHGAHAALLEGNEVEGNEVEGNEVEGNEVEGNEVEGGYLGEGAIRASGVTGGEVAEGAAAIDPQGNTDDGAIWSESAGAEDDMCTVASTVSQEEAWLFEATRALLEQLGVHGVDAQAEALLADAQGTLLALLPEGTLDLDGWQGPDLERQRRLAKLACSRAEAEAISELNHGGWLDTRRRQETHATIGHARAAALGMASLEPLSHEQLDARVRALADAMARHELELARLVLRFHRADGWRRLGYASETQYARERLGTSRSSLQARRLLALRLEKLPSVATALGAGQLGVEAALQVVRVATPDTQVAWVARARQRSIKHLREEVVAALAAIRWSGDANCPPPADTELAAFQALEQAVVSGRLVHARACRDEQRDDPTGAQCAGECHAGQRCTGDRWTGAHCTKECRTGEPGAGGHCAGGLGIGEHCAGGRRAVGQGAGGHPTGGHRTNAPCSTAVSDAAGLSEPTSEPRRAWWVMLASLAAWLDRGVQMSAVRSERGTLPPALGAGRVAIRLWMSRSTAAWWRGLAEQARRWLPRGMTWLRFLCLSLWDTWQHLLGRDVAYGRIYVRDRYRCTSPVCNRRDVTPHHLVYRSAGGSDEDDNVVALCTWCHLRGVHGGRIRACGTAQHVHWEFGAPNAPCLVVHGRERKAGLSVTAGP